MGCGAADAVVVEREVHMISVFQHFPYLDRGEEDKAVVEREDPLVYQEHLTIVTLQPSFPDQVEPCNWVE